MGKYLDMLKENRDEEYACFQAKLCPGVPKDSVLGVRVPKVRIIAKQIVKDGNYTDFLSGLPHEYYDENMLHALIISQIRDYDGCIAELEKFLPYVDNWAVCDIMSPKCFTRNKEKLINKIREWVKSDRPYTCRFGIEMLMSHYLDNDFSPEYLEIPAMVKSEHYYVKMMVAWFFATALSKQWENTFTYILDQKLDKWTHNKTIQKAVESRRITNEQKELLKEYKYSKVGE